MTRHSLIECISLIFIFISITYIFYTGIFENVSYNILKKKKKKKKKNHQIKLMKNRHYRRVTCKANKTQRNERNLKAKISLFLSISQSPTDSIV